MVRCDAATDPSSGGVERATLGRQTAKLKLGTVVFTRQCIPRAVAAVAGMLKCQVRRRVAVLQSRVAPLEVFVDCIRTFPLLSG